MMTARSRRHLTVALMLGAVAVLLGSLTTPATAKERPPTCTSPAKGEPMFITEGCEDPRFNDAYAFIDVNELRDAPVPHRFVHGGFRGTDARFSMYFPPDDQYKGRFILGAVHQIRPSFHGEFANPTPAAFLGPPNEIQFAFASGAYLVETNNGGNESCLAARDCVNGQYDPAIRGYRVNAAVSKFSRKVASKVYNREHR